MIWVFWLCVLIFEFPRSAQFNRFGQPRFGSFLLPTTGHEHKLPRLLGVNVPRLPGNWFW